MPAGSHSNVLIIDAVTGTAVHYTGIGALPCEYNVKPTLETVSQAVSVPWTDLGGTHIRAVYPGCVQPNGSTPQTDSSPSGSTLEALGERAIAPCAKHATTAVLAATASRPWKHGPVGAVPSGYANL